MDPVPQTIKIINLRLIRLTAHVAFMEMKMNEYRVLMGKSKGKRALRKPRQWWNENIKMVN
jgi:hypothetical protein